MAKQSAWSKGVQLYVEELREFLAENDLQATNENLFKLWSKL